MSLANAILNPPIASVAAVGCRLRFFGTDRLTYLMTLTIMLLILTVFPKGRLELPVGGSIRTGILSETGETGALPGDDGSMNFKNGEGPELCGLLPALPADVSDSISPEGYTAVPSEAEGKADREKLAAAAGMKLFHGEGYSADTTIYASPDMVEREPELLWMKYPVYPDRARQDGIEGKAVLHVLVSSEGKPMQVTIISEMPADVGFGPNAAEAAETAVFTPGIKNGKAVCCWMNMPVEFEIN